MYLNWRVWSTDGLPCVVQPKVVTDAEEDELRTQMEELRMANEEVAGDDDTSDQDEMPAEGQD